ncbi:MAG TPA: phage holin family protein [Opitutaceae bacterium]|nr:phage holin family protein [Opitutaceae bacterium]
MSTVTPGSSATSRPKRSPFENWISLAGAVVAAGSFFAFVFLFAIQAITGDRNQYLGILTFVVAPVFLITGLGAILVGWLVHRRRLARLDPAAPRTLLTVDLSRPRDRRNFALFLGGAFLFLLLTAFGSYQTFHYTESVEFCGTLCHTVMEPEFVAYQRGEHARVACVQCHVGGGAGYYVKSKISGARQLYSLAFGKYNRPIPTPIENLRPAQETCEQCHWPERFTGSLERRYNHLLSDKANSTFSIRLLLDVGGTGHDGRPGGIHWHMSKANKVEYYADDAKRQNIVWVRTTLADGKSHVYRKGDFQGEPPASAVRTMDCVDCHTRPAHNFRAPNDALERAVRAANLDLAALPLFKHHAAAALTAEYATVPEAIEKIAVALRAKYPPSPALEDAIAEVQTIYQQNFFPVMKSSWRAYPDNIGHKNWPGCFRCHNDELLAGASKLRITQNDCNSCHVILAQGSGAQLHQLAPDGLEFAHPEGETNGLLCSDCHNGANQ